MQTTADISLQESELAKSVYYEALWLDVSSIVCSPAMVVYAGAC